MQNHIAGRDGNVRRLFCGDRCVLAAYTPFRMAHKKRGVLVTPLLLLSLRCPIKRAAASKHTES